MAVGSRRGSAARCVERRRSGLRGKELRGNAARGSELRGNGARPFTKLMSIFVLIFMLLSLSAFVRFFIKETACLLACFGQWIMLVLNLRTNRRQSE